MQTNPNIINNLNLQQASEAYINFASKSLEQHLVDKPQTKTVEIAGKTIRFVDLTPKSDHDENSAVILTLPFANGFSDHMYLRAKHLQEVVAPEKRLIVLPQSIRAERAYDLSKEELAIVADGDLSPIAERQARLIKHLGLGRISLAGYSFGGMSSAVLANVVSDDAELFSVGIFEPPNIVEGRTPKQLSKDFKTPGIKPFVKAINDSQIPALNEAFGIKENGTKPSRKMLMGFAKFGLFDARLKENKAIHNAMANNSLATQVDSLLDKRPEIKVLIANASDSLIAPTPSLSVFKDKNGVELITIQGYGHEAGDNIPLHSELVAQTLKTI